MKKLLEWILRGYARAILGVYQPVIVGVTGSVGKTSTKEAIATVLSSRWSVRRSTKNYNNELGVPLTIIGAASAGRSVLRWIGVFCRASLLALFRSAHYPDILVLEMGADHPGDIRYLTNFLPVDIGVLTAVSAAHTEFFDSLDAVFAEKRILLDQVRQRGAMVCNTDDARIRTIQARTGVRRLNYGYSADADVCAKQTSVIVGDDNRPTGIRVHAICNGKSVEVFVKGTLGVHQAYPVLAALAVGEFMGIAPQEGAIALEQYQPPAGRMRLLAGIKGTLLIDDSYNASPVAVHAALNALAECQAAHHRIACLGTMAELGARSELEHEEVGQRVAAHRFDLLLTVGAEGKGIARAAERAGLPRERIASFDHAEDAGRFLQEQLTQGDVVLIKGSQAVRMEKVVKEVMAEPERANELLVRQGGEWRTK